jgi:tetratricopeptide (TPR) repeat protein
MAETNPKPAGAEPSELPDDPLQQYFKKALDFAKAHQRQLIISAAAVCCIVLVVAGVFYFLNRAENNAAARLLEINEQARLIDPEAGPEAYEGIKQEFASLVQDYGYTDTGKIALMHYASLCLATGDPEKALSLYETAWKKFKNNDRFNYLVLNGIAHCHVDMGNDEQAVSYFQKVVESKSSVIDDMALFNLGLLYEKLGSTEESRRAFEKIVSDHSGSIYADAARARISG